MDQAITRIQAFATACARPFVIGNLPCNCGGQVSGDRGSSTCKLVESSHRRGHNSRLSTRRNAGFALVLLGLGGIADSTAGRGRQMPRGAGKTSKQISAATSIADPHEPRSDILFSAVREHVLQGVASHPRRGRDSGSRSNQTARPEAVLRNTLCHSGFALGGSKALDHSSITTSLKYVNATDEEREAIDRLPIPAALSEDFALPLAAKNC